MAINFEALREIEPRLTLLEEQCRHFAQLPDHERTREWYLRLKPSLTALVGWRSGKKGVLETSEAYDVAYQHLCYYVLGGNDRFRNVSSEDDIVF